MYIKLPSGGSDNVESLVDMYWNGQQTLNKTLKGNQAVPGPLLLNRTNWLGICDNSDLSERQTKLESDGFDGGIANFYVWNGRLSQRQMAGFTSCITNSFEEETFQNLVISSKSLKQRGNLTALDYDQMPCSKDYKVNMHYKYGNPYLGHKFACKSFGGELFLPRNSTDVKEMQSQIYNLTFKNYNVVDNKICDSYWIPATKDGNGKVWADLDKKEREEPYLPWAPGEPNGDSDEKCVMVKFPGNGTLRGIYYDQHCDLHMACSLCTINSLQTFYLLGLPKEVIGHVDTKYHFKTYIGKPAPVVHLPGYQMSFLTAFWFDGVVRLILSQANGGTIFNITRFHAIGRLRNVSFQTPISGVITKDIKFTTVKGSYKSTRYDEC